MMTLTFPELEMPYGGIVAESLDAAGVDISVDAGIHWPSDTFDDGAAAAE